MKKTATVDPNAARQAIAHLFDEFPPVLVEARFPGTTPDWYLFEDQKEFDALLIKLGSVAELHVSSVWDLTNKKGGVVVTAGELTRDRE